MQTSSPDAKKSRVRNLALGGGFLCGALMLTLAESFVFPTGILPIPGTKPGLANAAVLLCSVMISKKYAFSVSIARVILIFFLFGNGTSVIYSTSGAILSFVGIMIFADSANLSFLGKSVISAILHNTAQILCAAMFFSTAVFALFPWMILSATLCGGVTGIVLNFIFPAVNKALPRTYV